MRYDRQLNPTRRTLLKAALAGVTALAVAPSVWAAWSKEAFTAKTVDGAMQALYNTGQAESSDAIDFKAPDIAENGAVVPVSVSTGLSNVESISIIVPENPNPLAAQFEIVEGMVPDVSTRIKMGKTSNVIALVKADGKLYKVEKEVKVTIGGCGG